MSEKQKNDAVPIREIDPDSTVFITLNSVGFIRETSGDFVFALPADTQYAIRGEENKFMGIPAVPVTLRIDSQGSYLEVDLNLLSQYMVEHHVIEKLQMYAADSKRILKPLRPDALPLVMIKNGEETIMKFSDLQRRLLKPLGNIDFESDIDSQIIYVATSSLFQHKGHFYLAKSAKYSTRRLEDLIEINASKIGNNLEFWAFKDELFDATHYSTLEEWNLVDLPDTFNKSDYYRLDLLDSPEEF